MFEYNSSGPNESSLVQVTSCTISEAWRIESENKVDRETQYSPSNVCAILRAWGACSGGATLRNAAHGLARTNHSKVIRHLFMFNKKYLDTHAIDHSSRGLCWIGMGSTIVHPIIWRRIGLDSSFRSSRIRSTEDDHGWLIIAQPIEKTPRSNPHRPSSYRTDVFSSSGWLRCPTPCSITRTRAHV